MGKKQGLTLEKFKEIIQFVNKETQEFVYQLMLFLKEINYNDDTMMVVYGDTSYITKIICKKCGEIIASKKIGYIPIYDLPINLAIEIEGD